MLRPMPRRRTSGCTITLCTVAANAVSLLARANPTRASFEGATDAVRAFGAPDKQHVPQHCCKKTVACTTDMQCTGPGKYVQRSPPVSLQSSSVRMNAATIARLLFTARSSLVFPLQAAAPQCSASSSCAKSFIGTSFREVLHDAVFVMRQRRIGAAESNLTIVECVSKECIIGITLQMTPHLDRPKVLPPIQSGLPRACNGTLQLSSPIHDSQASESTNDLSWAPPSGRRQGPRWQIYSRSYCEHLCPHAIAAYCRANTAVRLRTAETVSTTSASEGTVVSH